MKAKLEFKLKLEEMITEHIKHYPKRHLPTEEAKFVRNINGIYNLVSEYEKMFNENPRIQIYELDFYLRVD